ncbi:hypothetical protein F4823DRAFT_51329 [Ustulina deusta]|nr:hypothetical protein F4823DRAFT_51329 [Ustulina deusta]
MSHRPSSLASRSTLTMNIEEFPTASATTDGSGQRPRKRARYTRVACDLCKARKVKCSGLIPCSRCAELKVECKYHLTNSVYANAQHERNTTRLSDAPQQDLTHLLSTMKRVCDDIESSTSFIRFPSSRAPLLKRRRSNGLDVRQRSKHTHSATMNTLWPALGLVQEFLEDHGAVIPNGSGQDAASQATLDDATQYPDVSAISLRAARPLLNMGYGEVLQNLTTFEHEVLPVYPCIVMGIARDRFEAIFSGSSASPAAEPPEMNVDLIDIELGKVTLAIAMLIRTDDDNPLIPEVERHLIWNVDDAMRQGVVQVEDIVMAILLTIFFIVKDQLVKAWRMCGFAARSCLELGLHKQIPRTHTDDSHDDPEFLADIFNCVYDLDRRIGFITAMPLSLRDEDISESVFDLVCGPLHFSASRCWTENHPDFDWIVELT